MALKNISPSFKFSSFRIRIVDNCEIGLERGSELVEHPNLQSIFDGDILLVHTSLASIVLGALLCHVFTRGILKRGSRGRVRPMANCAA